MKFSSSVFIRALIILGLGIFLTVYPNQTSTLLVMVVGLSFMIPSLVAVLLFLLNRKKVTAQGQVYSPNPILPLLHVGSFLFGLILFLLPEMFITVTMYVLGVLIILFAANQLINLISLRQYMLVRWGYYVLPGLMMGTGIFMLVRPLEMAGSPFFLLGICCIICGITDLVHLICFRKSKVRPMKGTAPVPTEITSAEEVK